MSISQWNILHIVEKCTLLSIRVLWKWRCLPQRYQSMCLLGDTVSYWVFQCGVAGIARAEQVVHVYSCVAWERYGRENIVVSVTTRTWSLEMVFQCLAGTVMMQFCFSQMESNAESCLCHSESAACQTIASFCLVMCTVTFCTAHVCLLLSHHMYCGSILTLSRSCLPLVSQDGEEQGFLG